MTSRSGHYALNADATDGAAYLNNRRVASGWDYDQDGRLKTSADAITSSTQTWTYDARGNKSTVTETISGTTTTNTLRYDCNGNLVFESVASPSQTKSNYLINSTVLGGVLTKLDGSGNKDTTFVPGNGLAMLIQVRDSNGNLLSGPVIRDASGLQEGGKAVDPFGARIQNVQPPIVGPPQNMPFYGATYGGVTWNSFTNANNFSSGCYSAQTNNRENCNDAMRRVIGDESVDYFTHASQLLAAENSHISNINRPYDDPGNRSGAIWLPPDDSIPGRFGHFVAVFGHVGYGSLLPTEQPEPINSQDPQQKDPCADAVLLPMPMNDESGKLHALLNARVAGNFLAAMAEIFPQFPGIGFARAYRTYAEQNDLYIHRASNPNPVAKPGTSRHESGFAFDMNGIAVKGSNGRYLKDSNGNYIPTAKGQILIDIFARHGFDWGASFDDPPHFEADPTKFGYKDTKEAITAAHDYYDNCLKGVL
jgi:hypothetical protein